jgi:hypothetical protein
MGYLKMSGLRMGISRGSFECLKKPSGEQNKLQFVERSKSERREPFQVFRLAELDSAWNIGVTHRITAMKEISMKNIGVYLADRTLNMS